MPEYGSETRKLVEELSKLSHFPTDHIRRSMAELAEATRSIRNIELPKIDPIPPPKLEGIRSFIGVLDEWPTKKENPANIMTEPNRPNLNKLLKAAKVLDKTDHAGRLPGDEGYISPPSRTVRNPNKDRTLSGKRRKKERQKMKGERAAYIQTNTEADQVAVYAALSPEQRLLHDIFGKGAEVKEVKDFTETVRVEVEDSEVVDGITTITKGRLHSIAITESASCPECVQNKPQNCTGWALNASDHYVVCETQQKAARDE